MATFKHLCIGSNVYIVRTSNGIDIETQTLVERNDETFVLENAHGVQTPYKLPLSSSVAQANENYFVCADVDNLVKVLNQ